MNVAQVTDVAAMLLYIKSGIKKEEPIKAPPSNL
jgi:hypothetical protein